MNQLENYIEEQIKSTQIECFLTSLSLKLSLILFISEHVSITDF